MNWRALRRRPAVPLLIVAVLLIALAAVLLARRASSRETAAPASTFLVFLLAPENGHEAEAGDYLQVRSLSTAPVDILEAELFIDGEPQGFSGGPAERAWWVWRAWQPGLHTLQARATTADGRVGLSPTVIVSVLAGDDSIEVLARDGETLQQIGAVYGVSPVAMAVANARLDPNPSVPLAEGERVRVPVPRGAAPAQLPGPETTGESHLVSISWRLLFNRGVERAYCYARQGEAQWQRMPRDSAAYFEGDESTYMQLLRAASASNMQVECWGWMDDVLQRLGRAEALIDPWAAPAEVVLRGQGFQFVGALQNPGQEGEPPGQPPAPPYSLRQPLNVDDCAAHGPAREDCLFFMEQQKATALTLEWEWRAPTAIDGFRIYSMDAPGGPPRHVATIANPSQRAVSIPLALEAACHGVSAYVDADAFRESQMAIYCPGRPAVQSVALQPEAVITTGQFSEAWFDDLAVPEGGVIVAASNYGNEVRASAGVRFDLPALPPGAQLQRAVLKFSVLSHQRAPAEGNAETFCVDSLNAGLQDWTPLSGGENHYVTGPNLLSAPGLSLPVASLPDLAPLEVAVDVTPIVDDWLWMPDTNHGFVLAARPSPAAATGGGGFCYSVEGDFRMEMEYLAP